METIFENQGVTFEVGGRVFKTSKATVDKIPPDSKLKELISTNADKNGTVTINRNPNLFDVILFFIDTGHVTKNYPGKKIYFSKVKYVN